MKHTESFVVNSHDTDFNGVVRPSCVMRYMQETANLQFQQYHPNLYELKDEGKLFLLSRANMSVYAPLHNFDRIKAETWACPNKGVSFLRCSRLFRDDVLVAELATVWAFVDRENSRFIRNGEIEFEFGTEEPFELEFPARVNVPKDLELSLVGEREVFYNDIDTYGHMNNTNYPDMLCSFLPQMKGKMVVRCVISYLHEALLGEKIKIYLSENDGSFFFRTVKENGETGAEAEIVLDDI